MTENMQIIPSKEIHRSVKIGSGGFGVVYKGSWHGYDVAIKTFHLQAFDKDVEKEFMQEAKVMASLNHPAIIRLYGICTEPGNRAMLVELMPKGDLYHLLADKKQALPWNPLRWRLATDIGAGLTYLHANKILHRDLKSLNILLDDHLRAKITDFGLSRIKMHSSTLYSKKTGGSVPWMAPELFSKGAKLEAPADVYAYGVVLWEIASRKIPFASAPNPHVIPAWVMQGDREDIPKDCPALYAKVVKACWAQKPEERPTVLAALTELRKAQPQKTEPLHNTNVSTTTDNTTFVKSISEKIKTSISTKTGFDFGSEEFRTTSAHYATSFKDGKPDKLWNTETGKVAKTFGQHSDAVLALCPVSTDKVASGSYDKKIKIWNLKTGQCVQILEGHTYGVYALAALANGHIVSASQDKTLRVWAPEKRESLKTLQGHSEWVQTVVALPNNQVASGSADKTIKIWDTSSGKCLKTLSGHQFGVCSLAYLSNGQLASGSYDHTIKLWDLDKGESAKTLEGHSDAVYALVQLPNGQLASASYDKTIKIWDLKSGKCVRTISGHSDIICALALLSNGKLASGSADSSIKLWDVSNGKCLNTLNGHTNTVYALTQQLGRLVSGSENGKIKLWDMEKWECVSTVLTTLPKKHMLKSRCQGIDVSKLDDWKCLKVLGKDKQSARFLAALNKDRLASSIGDSTVRIWDVKVGTCLSVLKVGKGRVSALTAVGDDQIAVGYHYLSVGIRSTYEIRIWNTENATCLKTLTPKNAGGNLLHLIYMGSDIVVARASSRIDIWDIKSGSCTEISKLNFCGSSHFSDMVAMGKDLFAYIDHQQLLEIWNTRQGSCVRKFKLKKTGRCTALTSLGAGKLAVGVWFDRIEVWDTEAGHHVKTVSGKEYRLEQLLAAGSNIIMATYQSNKLKFWNIDSGRSFKELKFPRHSISKIECLGNNKIAIALGGGTIEIWGLDTPSWKKGK